MKYLFDAEGRAALAHFARGRTLLAFDYDGTLAPIVAQPADAAMGTRTRGLLAALARRAPVVIVSGRARQDLLPFLHGVPVLEVIGSHGAEAPGGAPVRFSDRVRRWRSQLEEQLRALRGVAIEDKRYSLAVHYRNAEDPAVARKHIAQAGTELAGVRVIGGKSVVNFVPEEAPHKGRALLAARERLGCARAIYAGDDDTDEDVFAYAPPEGLMGIRIGEAPASTAEWFVREQDEVDALLEAILAARS